MLIKGEPGTGKTLLAEEVAATLGMPPLQWHIKSTTKAQQGLYEYDAVSRLRDGQLGESRVHDIGQYIVKGVLWQAFESEVPCVVLIDEIDKADIEFPNDLLRELDRMEFHCYETRQTVQARHRPLVIITSNNEKELPDVSCGAASSTTSASRTPRRCNASCSCTSWPEGRLGHAGPCRSSWGCGRCLASRRKPSTSELIDWMRLLAVQEVEARHLQGLDRGELPPLLGALLKNEQDISCWSAWRRWRSGAEQRGG